MTIPGDSSDPLQRLLGALADETLTADDQAELAALLRDDAKARQTYYEHVKLIAPLRREGRRDAASKETTPDQLIEPVILSSRKSPSTTSGIEPKRKRIPNWALFLVPSIVIALGLSVGEATGITHFVPTVIRIIHGEGALVIEVDDPGVSVSLDGEDVTINGAGIHELRLKPGTHKFRATRDGKPVREEVVTIDRGGKKVLKVIREKAEPDRVEQLRAAEARFAEAQRLYTIGEPLRTSDPWRAELPFREALALYNQLVAEFPDVQTYQARRRACRFMLASTLGLQSNQIVRRSTRLSSDDAAVAVATAKEATELLPEDPGIWTHLGRACYRAGDWPGALAALTRGPQIDDHNSCSNRFWLAMTHWQLGNKAEARQYYDQAAQWREKNKPGDRTLRPERDEAAKVLGLDLDTSTSNTPKADSKKP